jgi:2-methylaconitate cis-trans-isomerase PrpF
VRINVLNNGDNVVCDIEEATEREMRFTVHFLRSPATPVAELLMTGEPVTTLTPDGGVPVDVSLVSMGNPYVFVAAEQLGTHTLEALFADDPRWFATLSRLREHVCGLLGWNPRGAFPKIAALLPDGEGALAARAISVPTWHPTLALTGAIGLAAATRIPGTIPWSLTGGTEGAAGSPGPVRILTAGGELPVTAHAEGDDEDRRLSWVSVGGKRVSFVDSVALSSPPITTVPKDAPWLSLPI